jgi:hypothetical protein
LRGVGGIALGAMWAALLGLGCQGGYPIPASQCDQWCDAAKVPCAAMYVTSTDPAECVRNCVRRGGDATECEAELDVTVACLREPASAYSDCSTRLENGQPRVCDQEQTAYEQCTIRHGDPSFVQSGWY